MKAVLAEEDCLGVKKSRGGDLCLLQGFGRMSGGGEGDRSGHDDDRGPAVGTGSAGDDTDF